jgi:formylglycine-generating enzyme required for sulfatase activity
MRSHKDKKQPRAKAKHAPKDVADQYQRALTALAEENRTLAQKLLGEIVAVQPDYQDAALYLWLACEDIAPGEMTYKLQQALEHMTSTAPQPQALPPSPATPSGQPMEPEKPHLQEFRFETITVNAQGEEVKRATHAAWQELLDLGHGITLEMVSIPAGTFLMGSRENEEGRYANESQQTKVAVEAFWMGKFPVTQAQWEAVMSAEKPLWDLRQNINPSRFKGANRPIENVSWYDAIGFCQRLSRRTGQHYRLPTEAEWEYACRAGTLTPFYFGETITPELANYNGNYPYASAPKGRYRQETTEVGLFPPNAFGLYDMHGNVWEWCQNVTDGDDIPAALFESSRDATQVKRGGSWFGLARSCRSANRFSGAPGNRHDGLGFRLVRT